MVFLRNFIFQVKIYDGLTGSIEFDSRGYRANYLLDVIKVKKNGTQKIGTWCSTLRCNYEKRSERLNFTQTYEERQKEILESLEGKHFIVTTALVSAKKMHKYIFVKFIYFAKKEL